MTETTEEFISPPDKRESLNSYSAVDDVTLSPIQGSRNVARDRTVRFSSPVCSACSTDSSFAKQVLADTSLLLTLDPTSDHLPSRLYKMADEYWNKYPKTDYTYSPMSKDRVELAPGQVAMPNMSRRSLSQFRIQGPNTSADEVDYTDRKQASLASRTASTAAAPFVNYKLIKSKTITTNTVYSITETFTPNNVSETVYLIN